MYIILIIYNYIQNIFFGYILIFFAKNHKRTIIYLNIYTNMVTGMLCYLIAIWQMSGQLIFVNVYNGIKWYV